MTAITFFIPELYSFDLRKGVWCKDNTQPNLQKDGGICLFQSIFLSYWVIALCCFWFFQAIELYLKIVQGKTRIRRYRKYYLLSTQSAGYQQGQLWCFDIDPQNTELEIGLEFGLFFGIIILVWFAGTLLMFFVLYEICKITKLKNSSKKTNRINKSSIYRTPMFSLLIFFYVWLSIIACRFSMLTTRNAITTSAADWIECLFLNFKQGISDAATSEVADVSILFKYGVNNGSGCGDVYPVIIEFSFVLYLICIISLQGVFVCLIFGLKRDNILFWKTFCCQRRKALFVQRNRSSLMNSRLIGRVLNNTSETSFLSLRLKFPY